MEYKIKGGVIVGLIDESYLNKNEKVEKTEPTVEKVEAPVKGEKPKKRK